MLSFSNWLVDLKIYFRIPVIIVFKNQFYFNQWKIKRLFPFALVKIFLYCNINFESIIGEKPEL